MKKDKEIKLQRLKVRIGWEMVTNHFLDIDITQYDNNDPIWENFTENMMYIKQETHKRKNKVTLTQKVALDLSWYPDNDPKGQFYLKVIKDDDFINPIETFVSRDKDEIVNKIEEYLLKLNYITC